ncbi:hypothetical protein KW841_15910 [Pseudomonas sp. PDM28]|uniref:Tc toxin subunit A n=1 Tax=Pseudomonas sp. PDM28 TaxID=2854770 RepID=UPI001C44FAD2|nr:Tc toxin subunit A [Pseudomonas sp. PDM28]MBV7553835.1 hypothetical protein [Pseudomonas sp. PDM28]
MTVVNQALMNALVAAEGSPKKGRSDFATALQKMGFTSVFDIVRLSRSGFARQLAVFSDANAELAYDNAMGYAALIARLYREYRTSSGKFQHLAQRSGVHSLTMPGPTFPNLFKENWDEFCKVGAIAAVDSPVAYLSELRGFVQQLEETSEDPKRILLDDRRPDLKDLLITRESTFTPRPMLEIVNDVLTRNLENYLSKVDADKNKPIYQVLSERHYPFTLPYNFYHQQCAIGLEDNKPKLGEFNYRISRLLPIAQNAINDYGKVQQPVLQAQRLLSGLSPQRQSLLTEASPFSNFYLTRSDLSNGWKSHGSTYLGPHKPLGTCFLVPLGQPDVGVVTPKADEPTGTATGTNKAPLTFKKTGQSVSHTVTLDLNSSAPGQQDLWMLNLLHSASAQTHTSFLKVNAALPEPTEEGYVATFDLLTATGTVSTPAVLARQRFTLTLDEHYHPTEAESNHFTKAYGVAITDSEPAFLADLNNFMQRTGLHAEQVEMLLAQRAYAVRLSPNCPSTNLQHDGGSNPPLKDFPFPHANHYGACYVNGTGSGLYDSETPPTPISSMRDQFHNAMDLVQVETGDTKTWRLTKTSLNRFDRLQRMIRLQRWTGIPFAKLDTLIISAIRAEGEANLGMELNENTLRALGVFRHLNQRHGIDPQEFAALMHDLTPYASGKNELPLFDQVFNRVQLFDTPLILDQTALDLNSTTPANQKTLLQLCAGLGLQPTEDSLLLIAKETQKLGSLKRDLPTVSSLFRQARIAQLFGLPVADLLTLANLLGGGPYKTALASGRLKLPSKPETTDILDVLMQLDWAVDWLKDSQQTVAQLQQRLGPNIPVALSENSEGEEQRVDTLAEEQPLSDDQLKRLNTLHEDTVRSVVTEQEVTSLGLPTHNDAATPAPINWFTLLKQSLLAATGLLRVLDRPLAVVDEPHTRLKAEIDKLVNPLNLTPAVKDICAQKLLGLLLDAHDRQTQLLEALFQETAKLPPDRSTAVIHWAHSSVYSILVDALKPDADQGLVEHFQRVSRHAEIALQLRLSNSAIRLFVINPQWLGGDQYPGSNSEPSLSDLYLFERFSHWLHAQREPEDALLSYFSLANPTAAKLKNKALRQVATETANSALARLLEWPAKEIEVLTATLPDKRAKSMAQIDWVRRCQATCQASGLSAKALLQATELNDQSTLDAWKSVGDAVMAAHNITAHSSLASV